MEANIAPQVAFEILSPSNTPDEMADKREFYRTYGVEEYYQFDPDGLQFHGATLAQNKLRGWQRQGQQFVEIPIMNGWTSPRLGIRFDTSQGQLLIYRPDGDRFLSPIELRQRVDAERDRANTERDRAEKLTAYLKSIGIDPEQIP